MSNEPLPLVLTTPVVSVASVDELITAALEVAQMMINDTGWDIADKLNCTEAEKIAELIRAAGLDPSGFLESHADGDEEGDDHWTGGSEPQPRHRPSNAGENAMSGSSPCACRDCMDAASSNDTSKPELCLPCREAGCEPYRPNSADYNALPAHMRECQREDAYEAEG